MRPHSRVGPIVLAVLIVLSTSGVRAKPIDGGTTSVFLPLMVGDGQGKHGLAWSYVSRDGDAPRDYAVSWYYHWSVRPVSGVNAQFVPMLWSDDEQLKTNLLNNWDREYCGFMLVANEPEFMTQADMTVEELIDLIDWVAVQYPCAEIVAPQTHVCWYEMDPPTPPCPSLTGERFTVEEFIRTYQLTHEGASPPIYAWGLHYGNVTYWPERLAGLMQTLRVPQRFWYTEFNYCSSNMEPFREWLEYLNAEPLVERYAYWTNMQETDHCVLADYATGTPNERGRTYASFSDFP